MKNEREGIIRQVRRNCDISDAQGAGIYSICGLALRLRDLYKWENGLAPWVEKDSSQILDWIGARENLWEGLMEAEYEDLVLFGRTYSPFDTVDINAALSALGLYYGAGYAQSLKPTFFLSTIRGTRSVNGFPIHILGRELARDLLTIPALHQDGCILLREPAARLYLWDQMMYLKKSGRPALNFALDHCGLPDHCPDTVKTHLESILDVQKDIYIYHELGELKDTVFDVDVWRKIIAAFPHTPVELFARAVKDLLADTGESGTLRHIIREKNKAGLGLYVAFVDGLLNTLFSGIRPGFDRFASNEDWQGIERVVDDGFRTAKRAAERMTEIFNQNAPEQDMDRVQQEIYDELIRPIIT